MARHNRQFDIFAAAAPGLEQVCAAELAALGVDGGVPLPGGVEFRGDLRTLYLANLWLRSAGRVAVRVGNERCRDFPDLYRRCVRLPWGRFVRPETPVSVTVTSRQSRLWHRDRVAETVGAAIDRALGRDAPPAGGFVQQVLVRIEDDTCQLSVDSSGDLLHRRGYRQAAVRAPLRETLAAGILQLLGWRGDAALVDPFCGSGSFPIEAGLIAAHRAPGLRREFAFMRWPGYRDGLWQLLVAEAQRAERPIDAALHGGDRDPAAVSAARTNAARAGLDAALSFVEKSVGDWDAAPAAAGLVIANPPYGLRLEDPAALAPLYAEFGRVCRHSFPGWQVALLTPRRDLARATGLAFATEVPLLNGGRRVHLFATEAPRG